MIVPLVMTGLIIWVAAFGLMMTGLIMYSIKFRGQDVNEAFMKILTPTASYFIPARAFVVAGLAVAFSSFLLVRATPGRGQSASQKAELGTAFLKAAEQGNIPGVKDLLAKGANVNTADADGQSGLMKVSENGWEDVTKFLLEHKAKVNTQDHSGETALLRTVSRLSWSWERALYAKRIHILQMLLDHGADVNLKSKDGTTPLMEAAIGGDLNLVNAFLKKHAEVNARDKNQTTALRLAKRYGRQAVFQRLKQAGGTE